MSDYKYLWRLKDGYPKGHGLTVMTTFSCGGGSSMGYKLAGYDVVCANDIDPQMQKVYEANHHPKKYILGPIKDLIHRNDLPQVDVLDGSPPCSTFSTTGLREKAWGKEKHFREGQAKQVLDDLFFDFIKLAEKMKPRVVIAENVSGMLKGNAKGYVKMIIDEFAKIGYTCQVFLLNAASMGVPQKRERVFFICNKANKKIKLAFNKKPIIFLEISDGTDTKKNLTDKYYEYWKDARPGAPVGKFQSTKKVNSNKVANTISASGGTYHDKYPRQLNKWETSLIGSWPLDYDFVDVPYRYLIGMSVPPVMMAHVAEEVYKQLLSDSVI